MAEPTSALTIRELIRDTAEFLGIASYRSNGKIIVPTGQHDFQYCRRIVNEAIRRFIQDAPTKGWRWMRRNASITFDVEGDDPDVNINSDAARYFLPEDFGGSVDGKIEYSADTAHACRIDWVDESFIRSRRSVTVETGYPRYAAIRPYQPVAPALTAARRWELIVDPQPSAADTVVFPYTMHFDAVKAEVGTATGGSSTTLADSTREEPDDYFNGWVIRIIDGTGPGSYAVVTDYTGADGTFTVADWLKADGEAGGTDAAEGSVYYVEPVGNSHPAGFMYDQVIQSGCRRVAEMKANGQLGNQWGGQYASDLAAARDINKRSAPRRLGKMVGGSHLGVPYRRYWNTVTTDIDI